MTNNKELIPDGTWVTMLTPFDENHNVDYNALGALTEWYIENDMDGIFAMCQSSEMFFLNSTERESVAKFVIEKVAGRIPVVVSGHVSDDINDQITELKCMDKLNPEALVLVTNRLAKENESEEVWKQNAQRILDAIPNTCFGLYECPTPYKRLLSPELLRWCADTGRFVFLKDTCCDIAQIEAKLNAVRGRGIKLFNANAATLLDSLKIGGNGFCGIMLNFFPRLYGQICKEYEKSPNKASLLQDFSTTASLIELQLYPVNAKYYLSTQGLPMKLYTKSKNDKEWSKLKALEIDAVGRLHDDLMSKI